MLSWVIIEVGPVDAGGEGKVRSQAFLDLHVLKCRTRLLFFGKAMRQYPQTSGFSPVCVRWCWINADNFMGFSALQPGRSHGYKCLPFSPGTLGWRDGRWTS